MLIVAIPKSASTALMKTLASVQGIRSFQDFTFKQTDKPTECHYLHRVHSDVREIPIASIKDFNRQDVLYKQHVYPSERNLILLADKKKVVLLREPNDIVLAYKRGVDKRVQNPLPGFEVDCSDQEWIETADRLGLLKDLNTFYDKWSKISDDGRTLIVQYRDLISNPKQVINRIENFYGLPITRKRIALVKARYSRRSKFGMRIHSKVLQFKKVIHSFFRSVRIRA